MFCFVLQRLPPVAVMTNKISLLYQSTAVKKTKNAGYFENGISGITAAKWMPKNKEA